MTEKELYHIAIFDDIRDGGSDVQGNQDITPDLCLVISIRISRNPSGRWTLQSYHKAPFFNFKNMSNKMQWSDKVDGRPPKYTKTTFAQKVQEYLEHMKTGDEGRLVTKI